MRRFVESRHVEYKRELTDGLEKEVVAFLNSPEGGHLWIGIDAEQGIATGLTDPDQVQLQIKDRLRHNISPSVMGLFDVMAESVDGVAVVKLTIASGPEKPYHLRRLGMSEKGCFLRVGSASEPMPARMIEDLFSRRSRNSLGLLPAPRQDLGFEQLRIFYQESGFKLNDRFAANLELLGPDGSFNYAAYLLSDVNGMSIKVARYRGTSRIDLIESHEFGYCCLAKAAKQVLDRLDVENRTFAQITPRERLERHLLDPTAVREAVINAIVHNDYTHEVPPKFELFSDRLEITSAGSLPQGFSREEFLSGYSVPRNKELMRVFKDIHLVEQLGSGVPRILQAYDASAFHFTENFLRIVLPFAEGHTPAPVSARDGGVNVEDGGVIGDAEGVNEGVTAASGGVNAEDGGVIGGVNIEVEGAMQVLEYIGKHPGCRLPDLVRDLLRSERTLERHLKALRESGQIEFVGAPKNGGYRRITGQNAGFGGEG